MSKEKEKEEVDLQRIIVFFCLLLWSLCRKKKKKRRCSNWKEEGEDNWSIKSTINSAI